jgi:transposase
MDEARLGQQGTLTRMWAPTGSRPTAVKQTEYEWVYLWAAVEPATGESAAMITPTVNTSLMNRFLEGLGGMLGDNDHAVLVCDQAGWHVAQALNIPNNITLLHLPPYSPELNPTENLWAYIRSHHLANRAYKDYDELLHAADQAYLQMDPKTIKGICGCPWIERAIQT